MLRSISIKSLSVAVSTLVLSTSVNAAILVIEGDQLLGADNVNVLGANYDVRFVEGSCNDEFNNCTNFTFDTVESVTAARDALASQVFTGIYDSSPNLTFGIEVFTTGAIYTPFRMDEFGDVISLIFFNAFQESSDGIGVGSLFRSFDMSSTQRTYASWTLSGAPVATVPVPAAVWLFGSGLIGLIGVARRKA